MLSRVGRPICANGIFAKKLIPSLASTQFLNRGSIRFESNAAKNLKIFEKIETDANEKALQLRDSSPVGQFGWLPFYGMVGTIMLSKELLLINAEFTLAAAYGAMFTALYIGLGETANKFITNFLADEKTKFDDLRDWQIEKMRVYKAKTQLPVDTVPVLQEMLKQQRDVNKNYLAAQNLEQRVALRQAFVDKLMQIKVQEDAAAAAERAALVTAAVDNVYAAFEEDKGPLREAALVNAISLLGTDGSSNLADDPVKKLFVKEFQ